MQLVRILQDLELAQRTQIKRALYSPGEFELTGPMANLRVSAATWSQMTYEEKQELEAKFHAGPRVKRKKPRAEEGGEGGEGRGRSRSKGMVEEGEGKGQRKESRGRKKESKGNAEASVGSDLNQETSKRGGSRGRGRGQGKGKRQPSKEKTGERVTSTQNPMFSIPPVRKEALKPGQQRRKRVHSHPRSRSLGSGYDSPSW